jgi:hypothetical protein
MRALILICLALATAGCGDVYDPDYWQQTEKPLMLAAVLDVEPVVCNKQDAPGTKTLGCAFRFDAGGIAVIHIDKRLTGECRACVLSHEEAHVAGKMHSPEPREVIRCGDGRMLRCSV